jgi:hypothetical protein
MPKDEKDRILSVNCANDASSDYDDDIALVALLSPSHDQDSGSAVDSQHQKEYKEKNRRRRRNRKNSTIFI